MPRLRWFFFDRKASQVRNSFEQPPKNGCRKTRDDAGNPDLLATEEFAPSKDRQFQNAWTDPKGPRICLVGNGSESTWPFKGFPNKDDSQIVLVPGQVTRFAWQSCFGLSGNGLQQWCGGWLGKFFQRRINLHGGCGELEGENVWLRENVRLYWFH